MSSPGMALTDVSSSEDNCLFYDQDESGYAREDCFEAEDDCFVPDCELEKVTILLRESEAVVLDTTLQDLSIKCQKQRKKMQGKTSTIKRT